jgi:hypothetical protein
MLQYRIQIMSFHLRLRILLFLWQNGVKQCERQIRNAQIKKKTSVSCEHSLASSAIYGRKCFLQSVPVGSQECRRSSTGELRNAKTKSRINCEKIVLSCHLLSEVFFAHVSHLRGSWKCMSYIDELQKYMKSSEKYHSVIVAIVQYVPSIVRCRSSSSTVTRKVITVN